MTTDAGGEVCVDELVLGDYTVTESVPAGYTSDPTSQDVTVDTIATCGDGNEATVSFHNTPLTNVTVSVDSQVDGGTASTIDCGGTDTASTDPDGDGSLTLTDREPGTITCTIVIDP